MYFDSVYSCGQDTVHSNIIESKVSFTPIWGCDQASAESSAACGVGAPVWERAVWECAVWERAVWECAVWERAVWERAPALLRPMRPARWGTRTRSREGG